MRSVAIHICFLFYCLIGLGQECPDLLLPQANATDVPVTTAISWQEVVGVTGYIISIGTNPGSGNIVNEQAVGSDTTFVPPLGLPEASQIFVTITLFFFDQPNIICQSISFTTADVTTPPDCTSLTNPVNGASNVNVATNLNWSYAPKAIGYRLSLGTNPGAGDIVMDTDLGNTLFYNPADNLPAETEIFVQITPYNENGSAIDCELQSFTTGELGKPPGCTMLISPADGDINVELSPVIEWVAVPGAIGYIVSIGSSPFNSDVLDRGVFYETMLTVINFEPNKTYFVRIIPFNEAGEAQGCQLESFSTILGCGPFFDENTGELIYLGPEINFPDQVGLCEGDIPTRITTTDIADGFRWFKVPASGQEVLLSDEDFVLLGEPGLYRYEAFNILDQDGVIIECAEGKQFTAIFSSIANIDFIQKEQDGEVFDVVVFVSGSGAYEYSLNIDGPYSDLNSFQDLVAGIYTVYVRDKNGCGIAEQTFKLAFPPPGFPPYFSPNGDGINDYWNYIPPRANPLRLTTIEIYDRYGKLITTFDPHGQGWDGLYNTTTMPLGGYWYRAMDEEGLVYRGHLSLIR